MSAPFGSPRPGRGKIVIDLGARMQPGMTTPVVSRRDYSTTTTATATSRAPPAPAPVPTAAPPEKRVRFSVPDNAPDAESRASGRPRTPPMRAVAPQPLVYEDEDGEYLKVRDARPSEIPDSLRQEAALFAANMGNLPGTVGEEEEDEDLRRLTAALSMGPGGTIPDINQNSKVQEKQASAQPSVRNSAWKSAFGRRSPETTSHRASRKETSKSRRQKAQRPEGCDSYLVAAKNNDPSCLEYLQQQDRQGAAGPPINARDKYGASALHFAARSGNLGMLQWLVEKKLSVRIEARNGATPAHDAAASGHLQCLQSLLYHDKTLTHRTLNDNEMCPIHLAAVFGHQHIVAHLVEQASCSANLPSADNNTALHYASAGGHEAVVSYLCDHLSVTDINATNKLGETALFRAVTKDRVSCVRVLKEAGADHMISQDDMLPAHAAARDGARHALQYLVGIDPSTLWIVNAEGAMAAHFAAAYGKAETLEWVLQSMDRQRLLSSWTDELGNTPVHDAAVNGQSECLKVFAKHNLPLNEANTDGQTPQDLARATDNTEAAIFLALKI